MINGEVSVSVESLVDKLVGGFTTRCRIWSMCHFHNVLSSSRIMYDNGPTLYNTTPEIHLVALSQKSLVHTLSPGRKSRGLLFSSWYYFCFACASHTALSRFGLNMSSRVREQQSISNVHSATFVVVCGVVLYVSRKLAIWCCNGPSFFVLHIACLNVWTIRSARPLDARCYGDTLQCLIALLLQKSAKSDETN